MTDDDYEFEGDDYDDEYEESLGACDGCECDLYEYDCYIHRGLQLCGQCYWHACGGRT